MSEYSAEQRLAKLIKLRELSEHPGTPIAQASAARSLLERLIKQWEVDPSALESEKVRDWSFKCTKQERPLACQVAWHMEHEALVEALRKAREALTAYGADVDADAIDILLAKVEA